MRRLKRFFKPRQTRCADAPDVGHAVRLSLFSKTPVHFPAEVHSLDDGGAILVSALFPPNIGPEMVGVAATLEFVKNNNFTLISGKATDLVHGSDTQGRPYCLVTVRPTGKAHRQQRRACPRFPVYLPVQFVPVLIPEAALKNPELWGRLMAQWRRKILDSAGFSRIRDISATGLSLVSRTDPEKGADLFMEFVLAGMEFRFAGKIVRKCPVLNAHLYGVRFVNPAQDDVRRLTRGIEIRTGKSAREGGG